MWFSSYKRFCLTTAKWTVLLLSVHGALSCKPARSVCWRQRAVFLERTQRLVTYRWNLRVRNTAVDFYTRTWRTKQALTFCKYLLQFLHTKMTCSSNSCDMSLGPEKCGGLFFQRILNHESNTSFFAELIDCCIFCLHTCSNVCWNGKPLSRSW